MESCVRKGGSVFAASRSEGLKSTNAGFLPPLSLPSFAHKQACRNRNREPCKTLYRNLSEASQCLEAREPGCCLLGR